MQNAIDQQMATKADIAGLDRAVKADFKEVRADIARLERELFVIKWMMGLLLGGVTALILKAFFPG